MDEEVKPLLSDAPPPAYGQPAPQTQPAPLPVVVVQQQPMHRPPVMLATGKPDDYLGLSLFACLCCCWPIGLCALFYSSDVGNLYDRGDILGAQEASRKARQYAMIAIGMGVFFTILSGIVGTVSAVLRLEVYNNNPYYG